MFFGHKQGSYTCEVTAVVTVYTSQTKSHMDMGVEQEIPPLPIELLAVVSCWERGSQFSLRE